MAKIKITITEVISQDFEVEVQDVEHASEEIIEMYKNGDIVLENPEVQQVDLGIYDEELENTVWTVDILN